MSARNMYLNFDDPRLLLINFSLPLIFELIFLYDLDMSGSGMTSDGWAPDTCTIILMINDFYF